MHQQGRWLPICGNLTSQFPKTQQLKTIQPILLPRIRSFISQNGFVFSLQTDSMVHNAVHRMLEETQLNLIAHVTDHDENTWDCHFVWRNRPNFEFTFRVEKDDDDDYDLWVLNSNHQNRFDYLHMIRALDYLEVLISSPPYPVRPFQEQQVLPRY